MKKAKKQEKLLEKARNKYTKIEKKKEIVKEKKKKDSSEELNKKLSKLTKEQQEALLKLLER